MVLAQTCTKILTMRTIGDDVVLPFNYEAAGMQVDDPGKSASCCGSNGHQNGVEMNGKPAEEISTDSEYFGIVVRPKLMLFLA